MMESGENRTLRESLAEDLAELDRVLAVRATKYFWVEGGTDQALGEFHYHVDCPEIRVEVAWGATLVTSDGPPTGAWWPGDPPVYDAKRVICAFCLEKGPSTEPCLSIGEGPACATCGCGKSFHEGDYEMFRGIFDNGCGMAWLNPVEVLALQQVSLRHCRCDGYRSSILPEVRRQVTGEDGVPIQPNRDRVTQFGAAIRADRGDYALIKIRGTDVLVENLQADAKQVRARVSELVARGAIRRMPDGTIWLASGRSA